MTNQAASTLGKLRWKGIPKAERSAQVPHNGGRPRIYPPCTKYAGRHRFNDGVCACGVKKSGTKS